MRECEHEMWDHCPCPNTATVRIGRKWFCEDHADGLSIGLDSMVDGAIEFGDGDEDLEEIFNS